MCVYICLLPTASEERGVLVVESIPVAILPSCKDMKTFALLLHKHLYNWVVIIGGCCIDCACMGSSPSSGSNENVCYTPHFPTVN